MAQDSTDRPDNDPTAKLEPGLGPTPYGNDPTAYGQQYSHPQPGYPHPQTGAYGAHPGYPPPYPATARATNTMAILALVFAFVFAPVGIVLGIMARNQIARTGEGGAGLAKAGLILGSVFTGLWVLWMIFIIVVIASAPSSYPY
jgi:Domain of unknown function (DUF4190)